MEGAFFKSQATHCIHTPLGVMCSTFLSETTAVGETDPSQGCSLRGFTLWCGPDLDLPFGI